MSAERDPWQVERQMRGERPMPAVDRDEPDDLVADEPADVWDRSWRGLKRLGRLLLDLFVTPLANWLTVEMFSATERGGLA